MKMSMWIIAKELSDYKLEVNIENGSDSIRDIRYLSAEDTFQPEHVYISDASKLFFTGKYSESIIPISVNGIRYLSAADSFLPEYVYISDASKLFSTGKYSKSIILIHRFDYIVVYNQEFGDVLNKLLSIFDKFNTWEASIRAVAVSSQSPLKEILKLSEEILEAPAFISDAMRNILAYTEDYGIGNRNKTWKQIYKTRTIPASLSSASILNNENEPKSDWQEIPDIYCFENGSRYIGLKVLLDDDPILGFCVLEDRKPLGIAHVQIVFVIAEALKLASQQADFEDASSASRLLNNILSSKSYSGEDFDVMTEKLGIEKPWKILALKNIYGNESFSKTMLLLKPIKSILAASVCTVYEGDFVIMVSASQFDKLLRGISDLRIHTYNSIGISMSFYNSQELHACFDQAQFALERGQGQPGLYHLEDYAYRHLLNKLREQKDNFHLLHPALGFLRNYDSIHGTGLYDTLYHYIANERSICKTAEVMAVHRNTLRGWLGKMAELLPDMNLEDVDTRTFILLSYLIDR